MLVSPPGKRTGDAGGLTPPLQIIKWTNNPIIKPSSPAATNRARVETVVLEAEVDVAVAEVDVPRGVGTGQRTGRPVAGRLRRPEGGVYAWTGGTCGRRRGKNGPLLTDGRNTPVTITRKTGCRGPIIRR